VNIFKIEIKKIFQKKLEIIIYLIIYFQITIFTLKKKKKNEKNFTPKFKFNIWYFNSKFKFNWYPKREETQETKQVENIIKLKNEENFFFDSEVEISKPNSSS
jgi:hypothetical protein